MRFALGVAVCGLLTGTVAFADDSLKSAVEAALKTFDPALKVEEVRETPIEEIVAQLYGSAEPRDNTTPR